MLWTGVGAVELHDEARIGIDDSNLDAVAAVSRVLGSMPSLFRPFSVRDRVRIKDDRLVYFPSTRKVDIAKAVVVLGAWAGVGLLSSAFVFGAWRLAAGTIAVTLALGALALLKRAPQWLLGPSRSLPLEGLTLEVVDSERRAVRHVSTTRTIFAVSGDRRWPLLTAGAVSSSFEEIPDVAAELGRRAETASLSA